MLLEAAGQQRRIRRAFSGSAPWYEAFSGLQETIGRELIGRIDGIPDGGHVLDVGMGTGRLTNRLALKFPRARVVGVDFAQGMVACAAGAYERFAVVQADAVRLPFKEAAFDAVFSNLAYQWVDDLARGFAGAHAVLKEKGVLCATLFAGQTLKEMFEAFERTAPSRRKGVLPIRRLLNVDEVAAALGTAGFADAEVGEERVKTYFENMPAILRWLKRIGANTPAGNVFIGREWLRAADAHYRRTFADDGGVYATFHVVRVRAQKKKKG